MRRLQGLIRHGSFLLVVKLTRLLLVCFLLQPESTQSQLDYFLSDGNLRSFV